MLVAIIALHTTAYGIRAPASKRILFIISCIVVGGGACVARDISEKEIYFDAVLVGSALESRVHSH